MQWLNEPASWQRTGGVLTVSADPGTDFWRQTGYGYIRDSGHVYGEVLAGDLDVSVRLRGTLHSQYDQAGVMLRADEQTWLKTGVEFFEGEPRLSTVLTLGRSSWTVTALPADTDEILLRVARRGDAVEVRYATGPDEPAQLAALVFMPPDVEVLAGVMCAAPEGPGFIVSFHDLYIAGDDWPGAEPGPATPAAAGPDGWAEPARDGWADPGQDGWAGPGPDDSAEPDGEAGRRWLDPQEAVPGAAWVEAAGPGSRDFPPAAVAGSGPFWAEPDLPDQPAEWAARGAPDAGNGWPDEAPAAGYWAGEAPDDGTGDGTGDDAEAAGLAAAGPGARGWPAGPAADDEPGWPGQGAGGAAAGPADESDWRGRGAGGAAAGPAAAGGPDPGPEAGAGEREAAPRAGQAGVADAASPAAADWSQPDDGADWMKLATSAEARHWIAALASDLTTDWPGPPVPAQPAPAGAAEEAAEEPAADGPAADDAADEQAADEQAADEKAGGGQPDPGEPPGAQATVPAGEPAATPAAPAATPAATGSGQPGPDPSASPQPLADATTDPDLPVTTDADLPTAGTPERGAPPPVSPPAPEHAPGPDAAGPEHAAGPDAAGPEHAAGPGGRGLGRDEDLEAAEEWISLLTTDPADD